jgi:hypothetical protein
VANCWPLVCACVVLRCPKGLLCVHEALGCVYCGSVRSLPMLRKQSCVLGWWHSISCVCMSMGFSAWQGLVLCLHAYNQLPAAVGLVLAGRLPCVLCGVLAEWWVLSVLSVLQFLCGLPAGLTGLQAGLTGLTLRCQWLPVGNLHPHVFFCVMFMLRVCGGLLCVLSGSCAWLQQGWFGESGDASSSVIAPGFAGLQLWTDRAVVGSELSMVGGCNCTPCVVCTAALRPGWLGRVSCIASGV